MAATSNKKKTWVKMTRVKNREPLGPVRPLLGVYSEEAIRRGHRDDLHMVLSFIAKRTNDFNAQQEGLRTVMVHIG